MHRGEEEGTLKNGIEEQCCLRKYNMQSYKVSTAPVSVMHPQTQGNSGGKAGLIHLTEVQN